MADSENKLGTGGLGDDRKQSPGEAAEKAIEEARKSKAIALRLSGLRLTELPASIWDLAELRALDVSRNRLTVLPDKIGHLARLEGLDVSHNYLTAVPSAVDQLTQLRELYAHTNHLDKLPESLRRLKRIERLFLHDNPALGLPLEVLGPSSFQVSHENAKPADPASILDYYFKMRGGRQPLNEVRLLLVGRGAAGKTSIVRRLIADKFLEGERETKGIDIQPWNLRCGNAAVRAHVWDFAGQVITHATHQFFLSHRSLYVLVLTGREDSERFDAEYWLRLIRAFGTESGTDQTSPVIVALNKWELAQCKVDRNVLQEKYPFIAGFVETDCRSGRGIAELDGLLRRTIERMESIHELFPQAWFAIKERLTMMKADYVSYGEFREQCRQLGESDAGAQDSLARVLHRLGVALNYADDERLREATVLNPHWVTKGIYTLLREAVSERGIMTMSDVERVLPHEKSEMRRYLMELMRRFDLAFPLTEAGDEWLVPQGLPATQPKLDREWQEPGLTRLRYTYTALPEGLIPRFITRTYPLSEGQERWVNGVVLVMNNARALIRADPSERCVTAVVSGSADGRRRLAGLVREDLRRIHADIRGLDPLEEMELGGRPGEWVRVQTLEADERKKQPSAAATREGTVIVDSTNELNRVSAPAARDPAQQRTRLFLVYSSRDARQHDELTVRLKPLRSEGLVRTWSDRCLVAGEDLDKSIRRESEEADMVLLLLSPDFLASGYLDGLELSDALERHLNGQVQVVPVVLRDCEWEATRLAQFAALPTDGRALANWENPDEAWNNVATALTQSLAERVRKTVSMALGQAPYRSGTQLVTAADHPNVAPGALPKDKATGSKHKKARTKADAAAQYAGAKASHNLGRPWVVRTGSIRVALSYSHKDERLRGELASQLAPLQRLGLFRTWHDRKISAGTDWKLEIDDSFKQADLILLLVSSDFIASDYCYDVEMEIALKRHAKDEARVVPIILRACLWERTPLGTLQALPRSGKPVTSWANRDLAWTDVVKGLEALVGELRRQ